MRLFPLPFRGSFSESLLKPVLLPPTAAWDRTIFTDILLMDNSVAILHGAFLPAYGSFWKQTPR